MSWEEYYKKHQSRPPNPLFTKALGHLTASPQVAIDLGCGAGIETMDLLKRGWTTIAIDNQATAIESIMNRLTPELSPLFRGIETSFDNLTELPTASFVYAYHSIPFCSKSHLNSFWSVIESAIEPNGIFAGSFFGTNDAWVKSGLTAGVTEEQLSSFFANFEILDRKEIDKLGPTALHGEKHWHIYEIIARKKS